MILFSTAAPKASQTALVALLGLAGIAMLANSIADLGGNAGSRRMVGKGRRILESQANTEYVLVGSGLCQGNGLAISTTNNVGPLDGCIDLCDGDPTCVSVQHNWIDGICQLYSQGADSSLPRENDISYSHTNCYNNIFAGRNAMETTCAAACAAEPTCSEYSVEQVGEVPTPKLWPSIAFCLTQAATRSLRFPTPSSPA